MTIYGVLVKMEMAETKWEQSSRESGTGCYVILMSPPMFDHVMVLLQTSVPMTLLLLLTNNAKMAQPMFDHVTVQAPTSAAPAPTRTVIIQIPASAITGGVATEATTVVIGGTATDTIAPAEPAPREPVAETKGS